MHEFVNVIVSFQESYHWNSYVCWQQHSCCLFELHFIP